MNEAESQLAVKARMETLYSSLMEVVFASGYGADFWPTRPTAEEMAKLDVAQTTKGYARCWEANHQGVEFDHIVIGAPTTPNVAIAMGAPHLWTQFSSAFKAPSPRHYDDIAAYANSALPVCQEIIARNQDIEIVNHYDPVHDRWLVKPFNFMRFKFKKLPQAYRALIRGHLRRNGTIIFLDIAHPWKQFQLAEDCYLQVGGGDGISDDETLQGSVRLDRWLAELGSDHRGGWHLPNYPLVQRVEAESSTPPDMLDDLRDFCRKEGYSLIRVKCQHHAHPGLLSAYLTYRLNQSDGRGSNGFLVEVHAMNALTHTFAGRLVPLHLVFPTMDAFIWAKRHLDQMMLDMPEVPRRFIVGLFPTQCCADLPTGRVPDRIAWDYWRNLFYSYARRPEDLIVPLYPPEAKGFEIYGALKESDDYFPRYITAVGEWVEHQENRGTTERFATLKELEWACKHSHFTFEIM